MGEIDNVHDTKDDGQTEGHQGEEKAHQDSLEDCIENKHKLIHKFKILGESGYQEIRMQDIRPPGFQGEINANCKINNAKLAIF
jgi:hypothetical protein